MSVLERKFLHSYPFEVFNRPVTFHEPDGVSIIVPMLDEIDNIDNLLSAILTQVRVFPLEILIADGGSTDGTVERAGQWAAATCVRLIPGDGSRGLAGDVLTAARAAQFDVVVVMDADLSHPPDRIADLVEPIFDGSSDMVVGSRYVPGGGTPDWPWRRRLLSRLGCLLAWPLADIRDPMSGFFAVRRERLLAVETEAAGFKIGLEIIAHGNGTLRVCEVPILFMDRVGGQSKIGGAQLVAYVRRLLVLAGGAVSASGTVRFATVGLIGVLVDFLAFQALVVLGIEMTGAHVASFCLATLSNYTLNARWTFGGHPALTHSFDYYARFLVVCLLALSVRSGLVAGVSSVGDLPIQIAILFAIGGAAIVTYLGSTFFVFPAASPRVPRAIRWRVAAIGLASYAILLRLLFLGLVDLTPQESYYWNYAQHLDIGYLDHPPLVAWLIHVGTGVFGDDEFGVRIFAWLGWFVTALFSFGLANRLFGKSAAFVSLLLVAALPFYFATGILMTPDAPLTACWAGTLYFFERALYGARRQAWWGVGICIGLGLISKYTIALLVPAVLLFMLLDRKSAVWLRRPEPYLAALLALVLFSPVVIWNLDNGLASFAFQSTQRMEAPYRFSLPTLVATATLLITPTGLIAALAVLWKGGKNALTPAARVPGSDNWRFIASFTLVPLSVLVAFSLFHAVKLNWTGPLWLAVLPGISAGILAATDRSFWQTALRRSWAPTIAICLVIYSLGLNYFVAGMPGLGYVVRLPRMPVAWSEFGQQAADIAADVEKATGLKPVLIGLDTYNIASQLAFYAAVEHDVDSVGRGVLGQPSLMYGYWHRREPLRGRPAVLFAFQRRHIDNPELADRFSHLSAPSEVPVLKNGRLLGQFYYRIGYSFE